MGNFVVAGLGDRLASTVSVTYLNSGVSDGLVEVERVDEVVAGLKHANGEHKGVFISSYLGDRLASTVTRYPPSNPTLGQSSKPVSDHTGPPQPEYSCTLAYRLVPRGLVRARTLGP